MTGTFAIGYSAQQSYNVNRATKGSAKKHVVVQNEDDEWVTACTGSPATYEYKGYFGTIGCRSCRGIAREPAGGSDQSSEAAG